MAREFRTVGVVGLGTMGAGIVEVFARNGLHVIAAEIDDDAVARGLSHLDTSTSRAVGRGKLTQEDADALLARITTTTSMADLADADLVVEAVPEHLELKSAVFGELDKVCHPDAVLASNTSSLSITELAVRTGRPGRLVGMHFFNPAPVQRLVELVGTVVTEPGIIDDLKAFATTLDKVPVVIGDRAGFIANALLFGYLNHAAPDVRAALRLPRGSRRRHALRLRLPDGPAGAARPHRVGHRVRDPRDDVRGVAQPAARPHADPQAHDHRGAEGPEERPRLLHLRGPAQLEGGAGRGDPERHRARPTSRCGTSSASAWSAPVGWRRASSRCSRKPGLDVVVRGRSESKVAAALAGLRKALDKGVVRGRLTEDERDAAVARVTGTTRLEDLGDVDLVVEAVVEELDVKRAVFAALDEVCKPGAILATTTSSLPVVECAVATARPADVIGMHFFNPAPVMKLVEVVSTVTTSPEVAATALSVCERIDKVPVRCGDRAGFIVNALLFPYLNDAVKMLEAHYATADDIDAAMTMGCALPMGPFELLDMVGLDEALATERALYAEFREAGFAPAPLLEHLVTAGRLGRKTGHGFRDYNVR